MPYGHARSCVARTTDSIIKTQCIIFFCFADFTLYMSFLRHMADTHERAYQDLQKRFFDPKVILQYDFYHECMSFTAKIVYGFMIPHWSSLS